MVEGGLRHVPYHLTFDDAHCAIIVGSGVVLGSEILAVAHALTEHLRAGNSMTRGWVDLCDITELRATPDEIRMVAEENSHAATFSPRIVVAVVASTNLAFGMARMWEATMAMTNWQTHVFRDMQQARTWFEKVC